MAIILANKSLLTHCCLTVINTAQIMSCFRVLHYFRNLETGNIVMALSGFVCFSRNYFYPNAQKAFTVSHLGKIYHRLNSEVAQRQKVSLFR